MRKDVRNILGIAAGVAAIVAGPIEHRWGLAVWLLVCAVWLDLSEKGGVQ